MDHNGVVIVDNRPSFDVLYLPAGESILRI